MAKFLSRMTQNKMLMRINVEFIKVETAGLMKDQFCIGWKRGPQFDYSNQYQFQDTKSIKMNDTMERISTFYCSKQMVFQAKTCEFKLISHNNNIMQSVTIDMSNYAQKSEECKVSFGKYGIILSIKFDIEPADQNKHSHLIQNNAARDPSIAIPEGTSEDIQYLQETNQEYIALSDALKEENKELKEQLEKAKPKGGSMHTPEKVSSEVRFLITQLGQKVLEVNELQKENEQLKKSSIPGVDGAKVYSEISFLANQLKKMNQEKASLVAQQKRYDSEVNYLVGQLTRVSSENQATKAKSDKHSDLATKEISFLVTALQNKQADLQSEQTITSKSGSEIMYLVSQLKGQGEKILDLESKVAPVGVVTTLDQFKKLQKEKEELLKKLEQVQKQVSSVEETKTEESEAPTNGLKKKKTIKMDEYAF